MWNDPIFWMGIGNVFSFIGTLFLMHGVIKNRGLLDGYDLRGSAITCISLFFVLIGFVMAGSLLNTLVISLTVIYWLMVVVYKVQGL